MLPVLVLAAICASSLANPPQPLQAQLWDTNIHFTSGGYRSGKPIELNGNFDITLDPGVVLDGIKFLSSNAGQHWKANGDIFRNVEIAGQLGVSMDATDSVFENCQFSKGGGWFVDWWGSHWKFTNCVITRQLLPAAIGPENYSFVAAKCTFMA
jgi:hypothetical protein